NFYFYGHGSPNNIGDGHPMGGTSAYLLAWEVATALGNVRSVRGGIAASHPYRFVFLDACETAATKDWQRAFGFFYPPFSTSHVWNGDRPPRAFLGWQKPKTGLGNVYTTALTAQDFGTTLNVFYAAWMSGFTLDYCIRLASSKSLALPLAVPGTE